MQSYNANSPPNYILLYNEALASNEARIAFAMASAVTLTQVLNQLAVNRCGAGLCWAGLCCARLGWAGLCCAVLCCALPCRDVT